MSRRTLEEAQRIAAERAALRLRCLVRNRDFCRDLIAVRRGHRTDRAFETYFSFLSKWGLQWFPSDLIAGQVLPGTSVEYERMISHAMAEYRQSPRQDDGVLILAAVVAKDPYDEYLAQHDDPEEDSPVPAHVPKRGTVLNIRVDLSYPQDVLEAIIRSELRSAKTRRVQLQEQGVLPSEPTRLHTSKLNFYLEVYDRHLGREPYRTIAAALRCSKSTVQYAHLVAMRLIGGRRNPQPIHGQPAQRSGTSTTNPEIWIRQHLRSCQICNGIDRWGDHCDVYKSFVTSNLGLDFVHFDEMPSDAQAEALETNRVEAPETEV